MEIEPTSLKTPTLCLNMIVKNESRIITRLLESVVSVIDCYCICDTGSSDNTCELIIDYFGEHKINGKIIKENFQNFEYNRNFSLNSCIGMSDYILLLDADMILDIRNFDKNILLYADDFSILQGSTDFYYKNTRIVRNNGLYNYIGVTHEYIKTPNNSINLTIDKTQLFINDYGDGGSKKNKFDRDIKLLSDGLINDPTNMRYHFYLANSYYCLDKNEEAIEIYNKRITFGGWDQEVWYSYYRIGLCYQKMGNISEAIYNWLEGYNFLPERLEGLYEIIQYYRIKNRPKLAIMVYNICKNILNKKLKNDNYLFLQNDIYVYKIDYEFTICASYVNISNINNEIIQILNNCTDSNIVNNLLSNMKFYKDILKPLKIIDFTFSQGMENQSFSSIVKYENNQYLMNIENGDKNIISTNKYIVFDYNFNIVRERSEDIDKKTYVRIEDIRLINNVDELQYNGTGYGKYEISNWVFTEYVGSTHIIYKWAPLQIYKLNKETNLISIVKEKNMPLIFSHLHGSTCGYTYNNEIWFVLHIVSHEQHSHCYHLISVFDIDMNLLRYSSPFKFKGDPVEYCIGLIVEDDRVLMSYSVLSETSVKTTQLSIYSKDYIDNLLVY